MAIDREQVLHVARLARLDLGDAEAERLTGELGAILDAVSKVSELDLTDVHADVASSTSSTPGPRTSRTLRWARGRAPQRTRLRPRHVPRPSDGVSAATG